MLPNKEHVGVVGFMLRYFRQEHETAVLAALKAEHERLAATGALFLSEADRTAQLERIDTELYVLGVHEELTVLRLESGDRKVLRRADALPRPCSAPYSRD